MSFDRETTRTTRKLRRCSETGASIEPGEKYTEFVGTWEGDFYRVVMLPKAAEIYLRANARVWSADGEPLMFGNLVEHLGEACYSRKNGAEVTADAEALLAALGEKPGTVGLSWLRRQLAEAKEAREGP